MTLSRTRKQPSPFSWRQLVKWVVIVFLFASSLLMVNKIRETHKFPIHQVKIYGAKNLNPNAVQHRLLPLVSKGFFSVEVDFIKEQLLQMPWVGEVTVRRVWPDQVWVVVTERQAVARWNENSLLSSTGELFNPDKITYPEGLPFFIGPDGQQIFMLDFYGKINSLLQPLNLKITRLTLSPYLSWDLEFTNGMKVRLGYKDILTRVSHFVKVYQKIVGKRAAEVDYVDLRYPNGLAVRWKTSESV